MKRSRESAGCIVRKTAKGLVPVSAFDQEQVIGFPMDAEFKLVPLAKRSLRQHRTYWRALSLVASQDERWATSDHLHEALKIACRRVRVVHDLRTGKEFVIPDSIGFDAMTQAEFQAYFDEAMAKLAAAVGYDPLAFLEEAA